MSGSREQAQVHAGSVVVVLQVVPYWRRRLTLFLVPPTNPAYRKSIRASRIWPI